MTTRKRKTTTKATGMRRGLDQAAYMRVYRLLQATKKNLTPAARLKAGERMKLWNKPARGGRPRVPLARPRKAS